MYDRITSFHPTEMTPAERSAAVAAILAAGILRHLHQAAFPTLGRLTHSQENPGEST